MQQLPMWTINPNTELPKGIAAIVGVGPKLGFSIARKFASEGHTVAILARDYNKLSHFANELARERNGQVYAIHIDCSESKSVQEAFEAVLSLGFIEILVYNACQLIPLSWPCHPTNFTDISVDSFQKSLAVSTVGAFHCAQQVIPGMIEKRKGTILFTGCTASLNGVPGFAELCCGKFALRALTQCMAKEFQHLGIHVAHVIIDGIVGLGSRSSSAASNSGQSSSSSSSSSTATAVWGEEEEVMSRSGGDYLLDPDALAQTYWQLHTQDPGAWTQEIDLRSSSSSSS